MKRENKIKSTVNNLDIEFIIVCKLYIKMKMREVAVEEQIQWVLLYV